MTCSPALLGSTQPRNALGKLLTQTEENTEYLQEEILLNWSQSRCNDLSWSILKAEEVSLPRGLGNYSHTSRAHAVVEASV